MRSKIIPDGNNGHRTRHKPSHTHDRVALDSGESILAEPGAMVSHSPTIEIETTTSRDGLLSSAKSMLGGESLLATSSPPGAVPEP